MVSHLVAGKVYQKAASMVVQWVPLSACSMVVQLVASTVEMKVHLRVAMMVA
jgi:hypothetical protein